MSIEIHPEYLSYNPCTVTIKTTGEEYVISNILTRGIPSNKPGAHIESLQIKPAAASSNDPDNIGDTGSVTLVDYKDAVFNVLMNQTKDYVESGKDVTYLSHITIKIDCFTGSRTWEGEIKDWSYKFIGTTPAITLNWTSIPSGRFRDVSKLPQVSQAYNTPKELINTLKSIFDPAMEIVDADGNDISDRLLFIAPPFGCALGESEHCSNNALVTYYNLIIQNCYLDKSGPPLVGTVEDNKFVVRYAKPEYNITPIKNSAVKDLVFVQNGSLKYYSKSYNDKYVIPTTSFVYNADQANIILQARVFKHINGNSHEALSGSQAQNKNTTGGNEGTDKQEEDANAAKGPSGITVSFDCYNVMSFIMNNVTEKVEYVVFNEFGEESVLSGSGTVTEVTYDLSKDGVVKASITATECFNSAEVDEQGASYTPGEPDEALLSSDENLSSSSLSNQIDSISNSSNNQDNAKQEKDESGLAYNIACEDAKPIPLSADKTEQLLNNGDFTLHVNEFFDAGFGDLKGTARKLKDDYVKHLIDGGNFGLVALLIAVANYGITGTTVSKWADPALSASRNATLGHYSGSAIGKTPFDRQTGGLGIAHWDSGNLGTIYADIGMPVEFKNISGFKELLTDNSKHPGKVTGWKDGTYNNEPRCFPVTGGGKCDWRLFDKGLKSNSSWQKWAEQLLNYKGQNGRIYQIYLFELWVKKFWIPTIKKLSKTTPQNSHIICVQDAIRLSRMANSANQLMYDAAGKTVAQQLDIYKKYRSGKADRYEAQFAFCQRASYVAGKLYQKY